jgi:hypothetical protein
MASKGNWIAGAIKKPGALTAKAKAAGALTKKGTIDKAFLNKKSKSPTLNKEKALAKTLSGMNKKKSAPKKSSTNNLKKAIMGGMM